MIRVQSEPGGGTVVRVFLPASNAAPKEPAGGAETAATEFARRRHILLVDDDPAVLRVTTLLLESFGFLVSQADNGQQAVEAVRRQADAFALVILDMTMPEMSGHEALDAIRAIRRDMPVLLTSGYREQDAAERMHGERPSAFIQKPFEFDALLLRVKQVLDEAER
jgi:CheY-like chemotaxis protein